MPLVKCPDCGKQVSESAISCPNCGCPNNGNFKKKEIKISPKTLRYTLFAASAIVVLIALFTLLSPPSYSDCPFYDIDVGVEDIVKRYGKPDDTTYSPSYSAYPYFEYTYKDIRFMGVKGDLVLRFYGDGDPGDLLGARWIIDGENNDKEKIAEICALFDSTFDKKEILEDGQCKWSYQPKKDSIGYNPPEFSTGYHIFTYSPKR